MANKRNEESAEAIERDIVETQDERGETVEQLQGALSPSALGREIIGDDGMETAKQAFEVAKRNPLPVAMIAIGTAWLFATSDAPMISNMRRRLFGGSGSMKSGLRSRSEEPAPIGPENPLRSSLARGFSSISVFPARAIHRARAATSPNATGATTCVAVSA